LGRVLRHIEVRNSNNRCGLVSILKKKAANTGDATYMANAAMCWMERTKDLAMLDSFMAQLENIRQDLRLPSLKSLLETWANDLQR